MAGVIDPKAAIDRVNAVFGRHPRARALHAKGAFYTGTFTPSAETQALTTAFAEGELPVLVRWSNGSGNPHGSDRAPDVRGMAVKFKTAHGDTDLLGQTAPRFPTRTPEDFLMLTEAAQKPWKLPLVVARRPNMVPPLLAAARAKSTVPPSSYAVIPYYPIHAYQWLNDAGHGTWVRFRFEPLPGTGPSGTFEGHDRLREEILARLAAAPVRFDLRVTTAASDDDPHDPMSDWKGSGEFSGGVIEVTGTAADPENDGSVVVFDPTRVVEGIGLSDDPILRYRPRAYSESVSRRLA